MWLEQNWTELCTEALFPKLMDSWGVGGKGERKRQRERGRESETETEDFLMSPSFCLLYGSKASFRSGWVEQSIIVKPENLRGPDRKRTGCPAKNSILQTWVNSTPRC